MMKSLSKLCLVPTLAVAIACLAGCAQQPKPLYAWGGYQDLVYEYMKGDGKSIEEQMTMLQKQLQATTAAQAAVPPGLHAHMGLLSLKLGQSADAVDHLQTERRLFPESAPYMDWLLKRAGEKKL